jgi:hypothetical protein
MSTSPTHPRRTGLLRRALAVLALAGGAGAAAGLVVPSSVSAAPYCGIYWGSGQKSDPDHTSATITNLRAGRHECFDRLVVDLGAPDPAARGDEGYTVRYVDQLVRDASGQPVALAGGARLEIIVRARAVTDNYVPTYSPADPMHAVNVSGFRTFRQVAFLGTFEAQTQIGLGVRARLPFRVFVLDGPGGGSRLVIDVAHRW